jgi:membrane protein implicated in regulation of membrane protease activity
MWLLSYVGSNFGLIIMATLVVLGLSAVAWFGKNWKVAVAAALVLAVAFLYMHVDKAAYQRRVNEEKAEEIATLKRRIGTLQLVTKNDTARAGADAKRIEDLERLSRETPANGGACLDRDAARRVRAIR